LDRSYLSLNSSVNLHSEVIENNFLNSLIRCWIVTACLRMGYTLSLKIVDLSFFNNLMSTFIRSWGFPSTRILFFFSFSSINSSGNLWYMLEYLSSLSPQFLTYLLILFVFFQSFTKLLFRVFVILTQIVRAG